MNVHAPHRESPLPQAGFKVSARLLALLVQRVRAPNELYSAPREQDVAWLRPHPPR
jgi:hypothetical protein